VTADVIVGALGARARLASAGRRVVAAQDTTEINFSGRSAARRIHERIAQTHRRAFEHAHRGRGGIERRAITGG
jgi:hypothetical protein